MAGLGYAGHFGLEQEFVYGTRKDATNFLNILGESFKLTREYHVPKDHQASPFDKIGLPTLLAVAGGFNFEMNGANSGWPLKMGTRTDASAVISAPPGVHTATPAGGGALGDGTYKYKIAAVYTRTVDSKSFLGGFGAEFEGTATAPNSTLDLSWSAATPPSGHTLAGYSIWRTAAGGGANTEKYLSYQSGSGTTWSDDGDPALSATDPFTTAYKHTFTMADADLTSYTFEINGNQTNSRWITGFKASGMKIDVPEPGKPITCSIDGMAQNEITSVAAGSPSFILLKPFSSHNGFTWLQTSGAALSQATKIEKMNIDVKYELDAVRSITGTNGDLIRALTAQRHEVTGAFSISFEDYTEYNRVVANTLMSLKLMVDGTYFDTDTITMGALTVYQFPYQLTITLPNIYYNVAQGNLNGPKRIVQDVPFKALYDTTSATDLTIELINSTTEYADPGA